MPHCDCAELWHSDHAGLAAPARHCRREDAFFLVRAGFGLKTTRHLPLAICVNSPLPSKISRFSLQRQLGAGAQGTVYLAQDSTLGRHVAIKTLLLHGQSASQHEALLSEARIVSQFSHPNIVTLYDAGENEQGPFLVFEYVDGTVLSRIVKEEGALTATRAAKYAVQVLKALAYAHQKGVMHRDIKPGNIIISADDTARVMDFGIAQLISSTAPEDQVCAGTPQYMAPEYANSRSYTTRSDLFSLGLVLYEMLTGAAAVSGQNVFEVLHKISNMPIAPPSSMNSLVPEILDDIVLKACARDPLQRYDSASEFEDALARFLDPTLNQEQHHGDAAQGTIEFLLRRMRQKNDFPALSNTVSAVNRAAASDTEGIGGLSNSILKDFALTNKLLRLVNSAYYGQFGGTISTISRAVVILGFERVRSVAMTLILFEHLQNKAQAATLKDQVVATYFSGILASELAAKAALPNAEEAFICAMFHNLGKLLVRFYFHEEGTEIDRLVEQGTDEPRARILGISSEELGIGIAKYWHLPDKIVGSMRSVRDEKVARPSGDDARLAILSEMSSDICQAITADATQRESIMSKICTRFQAALPLSRSVVSEAISNALNELSRDAATLNINTRASVFYASACQWIAAQGGNQMAPPQSMADENMPRYGRSGPPLGESPQQSEATQRKAILSAGIQDITNSLVANTQLNDILRIILETMYRGIGFTRVMMCIRDPQQNALKARLGFGQDIDRIIRLGFGVSLAGGKDVFTAALGRGADIFIENINADRIRDHVPDWYRKMIPAQAFALFPVVVNKKPVGLFYGDTDRPGWLKFSPEELNLLKTLRNQAVLAIKHQH
jgi:serine/threonine protein kinase